MNVIRMVKLFGWEKRVQEDIAEKREEELQSIKKRAIYSLINANVKYAPTFCVVFDLNFTFDLQRYYPVLAHDYHLRHICMSTLFQSDLCTDTL